MITHTEGKWEVKESDGVLTIVCTDLNNRKYYIADVNGDADYEPTYRANANLIASAPELLAFAQKWVEFKNGAEIDMKELWFMATQAIAKAEGSHTDEG